VQHKRVACGKEVLLRERLGTSSIEERAGKLDESVLRRQSTPTMATQKRSPAHEALWILRDGDDLCDFYIFHSSGQGADASVAPLAALEDLFRRPA